MRFLVDNALSPMISELLNAAGHDAIHVREVGMQTAPDEVLFDFSASEKRVLVSSDTDFGALLALREAEKPSFVLFRGGPRRPEQQADVLLRNLERIRDALVEGAVVVFEPGRIRIRKLPIG